MVRAFSLSLVVLVTVCAALGQGATQGGDSIDSLAYLRNPSAFKSLPRNIVRYLERNNYRIPQCWCNGNPHNVVSGSFARKGQRDWVVLASKGGTSSILVFWKGSTRHPETFQPLPDKLFLQVHGDIHIQYNRLIKRVGKDFVEHHAIWYGGTKPPVIDHEGFTDAYVEKTTTVHYYYKGKWFDLQKSD
jgi:hypothetical protein